MTVIVASYHTLGKIPLSCIHQVTTMLTTSENVLYLGHNHLLTTSDTTSTLFISVNIHFNTIICLKKKERKKKRPAIL